MWYMSYHRLLARLVASTVEEVRVLWASCGVEVVGPSLPQA